MSSTSETCPASPVSLRPSPPPTTGGASDAVPSSATSLSPPSHRDDVRGALPAPHFLGSDTAADGAAGESEFDDPANVGPVAQPDDTVASRGFHDRLRGGTRPDSPADSTPTASVSGRDVTSRDSASRDSASVNSASVNSASGDSAHSAADHEADLLADQLHRFDQQQRIFRLQVEHQTAALTEREIELELREKALLQRETQFTQQSAEPLQTTPVPEGGVSLSGQTAVSAVVDPPTVTLSASAGQPEASRGHAEYPSRPEESAGARTRPDCVPPPRASDAPEAALQRERDELHREKLLFEGRIRFQQEHLQRTLRDLEARQSRFQLEQQQSQTRLTEREKLLALRERQVQRAVARLHEVVPDPLKTRANPPREGAGAGGPDADTHSRAHAEFNARTEFNRERQAWEATRQQQQADLEQQRAELTAVFQELDQRRRQLVELSAAVERVQAQVLEAHKAGTPMPGSHQPATATAVSVPTPREANPGESPARFPATSVSHEESAAVIEVVDHGAGHDVDFEPDYTGIYGARTLPATDELVTLRAELGELQRQLRVEREAWTHERQEWSRWGDALEARHARELDQYRQRDEQWQQQAQRWQVDRDEARAVIVDLLARIKSADTGP